MLTQELDPFDCACLGVFINGIAGEKAFDVKGNGFSATDLVSHIGSVIKDGLH